jgi:hypothetical protein
MLWIVGLNSFSFKSSYAIFVGKSNEDEVKNTREKLHNLSVINGLIKSGDGAMKDVEEGRTSGWESRG